MQYIGPLLVQIRSWLQANRLRWGVATLAGSSVAAQSLSIVTAPITSRIYGVTDYGIATILGSICSVLCIIATLRLETAINLPREEGEAHRVLFGVLLLSCFTTVLVAMVVFTWRTWIFSWLGVPRVAHYWWMVPASLGGASVYTCLYFWGLRRKTYGLLAKTRLQQTLWGSAVMLGIGVVCRGPLGLLLSNLVSGTVGIGRLATGLLTRARGGGLARYAWNSLKSLRAYGSFAGWSTGAVLLNSTGTLMTPLLFGMVYGEEVAGSLGFARRLVLLPMVLVGSVLDNVFQAEVAELVRQRPAEVPAFFRRISRKMVLPAVGLLGVGAACPFAFPIVFGERWRVAGIFAALLAPLCSAQLVVGSVSSISIVTRRQDVQLVLDTIRAVAVVGAIYLPSRYPGGDFMAVAAYSGVMSTLYAVNYSVYKRLARDCSRGQSGCERARDSAENPAC